MCSRLWHDRDGSAGKMGVERKPMLILDQASNRREYGLHGIIDIK